MRSTTKTVGRPLVHATDSGQVARWTDRPFCHVVGPPATMPSTGHGHRSVGGQGDMSLLLFEVEGTPCVLSPYIFGGSHFCTNAHGIHWTIGAIFVQYSELIHMKIIKIFAATRCQILRLKCTKFNFGWGSAPDPTGELIALPQTL